MRLYVTLLSSVVFVVQLYAQHPQLSANAEISVLTMGAGANLNDAFGHNAFRVKDVNQGLDVVYGYGRYDFDAPNFYLKFIQGKLNYLISKNTFNDIYHFYTSENRSIKEHVLNFSGTQKQRLYNYLIENYKPQNRRYLYDFFYDNCATKIRDVVQVATRNAVVLSNASELKTFRQLLHEHVGRNTWGSFGIDLALGSLVDRTATVEEQLFLPNYIHSGFSTATLEQHPLVAQTRTVYKPQQISDYKNGGVLSPLLVCSILGLLIAYITYQDQKNATRRYWLDLVLFGSTSIVGIILLLLWFATDHTATGYNYNVLWAFPFNGIVLRQVSKSKMQLWVKGYLKFLLIMLTLLTLHWFMGVQVFALALIPLLLALVYRYVFLIQYISKSQA